MGASVAAGRNLSQLSLTSLRIARLLPSLGAAELNLTGAAAGAAVAAEAPKAKARAKESRVRRRETEALGASVSRAAVAGFESRRARLRMASI